METYQDWTGAYDEFCALIKDPTKGIAEITHLDLFFDQINQEDKEYPYPQHSVFFEFDADSIDVIGNNVQDMNMKVKVIYAYKTIADTYVGSDNKTSAFVFNTVMRKLHALFQGISGNNFSAMNRVDFSPEPSPAYIIAYSQTYSTIIRDYSSLKSYDESKSLNDLGAAMEIDPGDAPDAIDNPPLFQVEL